MGGCWSQSIDTEAMGAEIDYSSAKDVSAGNEIVQNNAGRAPAPSGSSEYIGAFMRDDITKPNAVEPTLPVSNNRTVQPLPRVSSDVHQNRSKLKVEVPVENTMKTSVDQPLRRILEEQPIVEQIVHNHVIKERPVTSPVPENQMQKTLSPPSPAVQYDHQNTKEPVFDVPVEAMVQTIVDGNVYRPLEEHSMPERTLHDQIIEEHPVMRQTVPNEIYEELAVHPLSPGDNAALPKLPCETQARLEVKENVQVVETQQPGHDLGIVFEGKTYHTRVFDPNLSEYVYVGGDDIRPRGGLVM